MGEDERIPSDKNRELIELELSFAQVAKVAYSSSGPFPHFK